MNSVNQLNSFVVDTATSFAEASNAKTQYNPNVEQFSPTNAHSSALADSEIDTDVSTTLNKEIQNATIERITEIIMAKISVALCAQNKYLSDQIDRMNREIIELKSSRNLSHSERTSTSANNNSQIPSNTTFISLPNNIGNEQFVSNRPQVMNTHSSVLNNDNMHNVIRSMAPNDAPDHLHPSDERTVHNNLPQSSPIVTIHSNQNPQSVPPNHQFETNTRIRQTIDLTNCQDSYVSNLPNFNRNQDSIPISMQQCTPISDPNKTLPNGMSRSDNGSQPCDLTGHPEILNNHVRKFSHRVNQPTQPVGNYPIDARHNSMTNNNHGQPNEIYPLTTLQGNEYYHKPQKRVPIHQWPIKFTGISSLKDPKSMKWNDFLKRIARLMKSELASEREVFDRIEYLLSGPALKWYHAYLHKMGSWDDFIFHFKRQYQQEDHDERTLMLISEKQQAPGETPFEYLHEMLSLFDDYPFGLDERRRVFHIMRGFREDVRRAISLHQPKTVEAIERLVHSMERPNYPSKRLESHSSGARNKSGNRSKDPFKRAMNEILPNELNSEESSDEEFYPFEAIQ